MTRETENDDQVHRTIPAYLIGDAHAVGRLDVTHRGLLVRRQRGTAPLVGGRCPVKLGGLFEHRPLEVPQRRARVDAELIAEASPDRVAGPERLGLPATPVQGEDPLGPQPVSQRVLGDEPFQLERQGLVVAAGELGVDAVLDGVHMGHGEPGRLGLEFRAHPHVAERVAAPNRCSSISWDAASRR